MMRTLNNDRLSTSSGLIIQHLFFIQITKLVKVISNWSFTLAFFQARYPLLYASFTIHPSSKHFKLSWQLMHAYILSQILTSTLSSKTRQLMFPTIWKCLSHHPSQLRRRRWSQKGQKLDLISLFCNIWTSSEGIGSRLGSNEPHLSQIRVIVRQMKFIKNLI